MLGQKEVALPARGFALQAGSQVAEQADLLLAISLQVQLLISAQDVENYKVIKSELDKLRTMVEKSELWVDKKGSSKGDESGEGNKKEKKEV